VHLQALQASKVFVPAKKGHQELLGNRGFRVKRTGLQRSELGKGSNKLLEFCGTVIAKEYG